MSLRPEWTVNAHAMKLCMSTFNKMSVKYSGKVLFVAYKYIY